MLPNEPNIIKYKTQLKDWCDDGRKRRTLLAEALDVSLIQVSQFLSLKKRQTGTHYLPNRMQQGTIQKLTKVKALL